MNHRPPKIWTSEDQIIATIDRTKRMAARKLKKSQELLEAAKVKFGRCEELRFELMAGSQLTEYQREQLQAKLGSAEIAAGKAKEKADAYAKAYHRAVNSTLPRLGDILSSFRTGTFKEVLGEYKAVSVR
jgi:hypothetical protein